MEKSIDTHMPTVDLAGPCFTCNWNCNENCAASLDTFTKIELDVGLTHPLTVLYDCTEYRTIDTVHLIAKDTIDTLVIERTPYLEQPKLYEPNEFDGLHSEHVRRVEYKNYPDANNEFGQSFPWHTDVNTISPGGPAVSEDGDVPSIDYAKRRIFGDGSFFLERKQIIGYLDAYIIYFMCTDDVDVEEINSKGSYEKPHIVTELAGGTNVTDETESGDGEPAAEHGDDDESGGLVDYSQYLNGGKDEVLDILPYVEFQKTVMPPNDRCTGGWEREYLPSECLGGIGTWDKDSAWWNCCDSTYPICAAESGEDRYDPTGIDPRCFINQDEVNEMMTNTISTRQQMKRNLRAVSVKPSETKLASQRGLYPHGVAHGQIFTDNFRKGFLEDVSENYLTTDAMPDTAHFRVEEEDCSIVVVKVRTPVVLGVIKECITAEGEKFINLERWGDNLGKTTGRPFRCSYFDPEDKECKSYQFGETLQFEKWDEVHPCRVEDNDAYKWEDTTVTYNGIRKTASEVENMLREEWSDIIADKHVIAAANVFNADLMWGGVQSSNGDWNLETNQGDYIYNDRVVDLIDSRLLPARHQLKKIEPRYVPYMIWGQFDPRQGGYCDMRPTNSAWDRRFTIHYDCEEQGSWTDTSYLQPIPDPTYYGNSSSTVPRSVMLGEQQQSLWHKTIGQTTGSGFVPKSMQIEFFLGECTNILSMEIQHGTFKPSELTKETEKTIELTSKYSEDWSKHSAACNVFIPTRKVGDAEFDLGSDQSDAFLSWNTYGQSAHNMVGPANSLPYLCANKGEMENVMTLNHRDSINMFCASQLEYWIECNKQSHVVGKVRGEEHQGTPYMNCEISYYTTPEWKSLAYTGEITTGWPPTEVYCAQSYDPHCAQFDYYIVGCQLECQPPSFDTQRVKGANILDYQHKSFRNFELPSDQRWNRFFDKYMRAADQGIRSANVSNGEDNYEEGCPLSDDDIRYIQLRTKTGNVYGVRASLPEDPWELGGGYCPPTGINPQCNTFGSADEEWPDRDSCPWWKFFNNKFCCVPLYDSCIPPPAEFPYGVPEQPCTYPGIDTCITSIEHTGCNPIDGTNDYDPMPEYCISLWGIHNTCEGISIAKSFNGKDIPTRSGDTCFPDWREWGPNYASACGNGNTAADFLPLYDNGYKWWRYYCCMCHQSSCGYDDHLIPVPFCRINPIDPYTGEPYDDYEESLNPFYGEAYEAWAAPSCGLIEYENKEIVRLQPVTVATLPLSGGDSESESPQWKLDLKIETEGAI